MKKLYLVFFLFIFSIAFSQSVRSLGMGGVTLPGPWATPYNPAFAAYSEDTYGPNNDIALPVGLINLIFNPHTSILNYFNNYDLFINNFDLISFIDQLAHPYEFIFNPPESPDEVVFRYDRSGISITDGAGNPLRLKHYQAVISQKNEPSLPNPFFELAVPTGISGLQINLGTYLSTSGVSLVPSKSLADAISDGVLQADSVYTITTSAAAEAGVSGRLSYAISLPVIGNHNNLYIGVQADGFYGLLRSTMLATTKLSTDHNGNPVNLDYTSNIFLAYPGLGNGYGGRLDFGIAADYQSGTYGIGLRNLIDYRAWQGVSRTREYGGNVVEKELSTRQLIFAPLVYFNGAFAQDLPGGSVVLFGADASFSASSFAAHAGIEYQQSIFRLRGGLGYENGLKLGLGGGIVLPYFGIDAALTSHQDFLSDQLIFGLAASLGFYF